jgi:hypothetical protein
MSSEKAKSRRKIIEWIAVAVVCVLVWIFWNFIAALVVALFLAALVLNIDSDLPFVLALVLLLTSALLAAIQQDSGAKVVAEWSFLFLAIGILVQFRGYISSGARGDEPDDSGTADAGRAEDEAGPAES